MNKTEQKNKKHKTNRKKQQYQQIDSNICKDSLVKNK